MTLLLCKFLMTSSGFGYKFDALNNEKKENELNKAFSILFNPNGSFRFFRMLELAFPFARRLNVSSKTKRKISRLNVLPAYVSGEENR